MYMFRKSMVSFGTLTVFAIQRLAAWEYASFLFCFYFHYRRDHLFRRLTRTYTISSFVDRLSKRVRHCGEWWVSEHSTTLGEVSGAFISSTPGWR